MPEMDGLTAFDRIARVNPDIGCIIISAEKGYGTMRSAMSLGVQDYLFKPFTLDELERAVDRVATRLEKERLEQERQIRQQQMETRLRPLAEKYAKSRRTDDNGVRVFEQLAENPHCEMRWLRTLAMLYVIRKEWGKLFNLAARLANSGK